MDEEVDPREALAMSWGPYRNLAMRIALDLHEDEICLVNLGDVVQCVVATRERAKELHDVLRESLGRQASVSYFRRRDGSWVVSAYESESSINSAAK
jgi:hypothetical protein